MSRSRYLRCVSNPALLILVVICLSSCSTNIYLYDRSDAPFFCEQTYRGPYETVSNDYVQLPLGDRYQDFFVLKKSDDSDFLIVKNRIDFVKAGYAEFYEDTWFRKKLAGAKVLVQSDMNGPSSDLEGLIAEIRSSYPDAKFRRPSMVDISVLPYSEWLAVDYAKKPCESIILGDLFLEFRLLPDEVTEFRQLSDDSLVLGVTVIFTDFPSGWRFHRSFSLRKEQIIF